MDDSAEAALLIATSMVVLVAFAITVLAVMLIYRKRKLEHQHEIALMNERFAAKLFQTQLEVQRQTMEYVGREIHDNVGQQLVLAFLYLQQPDFPLNQSERISNLINNSLTELRELSSGLIHDRYHESRSLAELLQLEKIKVQAAGVCALTLTERGESQDLSGHTCIVILRIVQEFIQNSLKHSACSRITIALDYFPDAVHVSVTDDGKGFDLTNLTTSGIGIKNMQSRAELLGGTCAIESAFGRGTSIRVTVPILLPIST